jgi:hypothetical protein
MLVAGLAVGALLVALFIRRHRRHRTISAERPSVSHV